MPNRDPTDQAFCFHPVHFGIVHTNSTILSLHLSPLLALPTLWRFRFWFLTLFRLQLQLIIIVILSQNQLLSCYFYCRFEFIVRYLFVYCPNVSSHSLINQFDKSLQFQQQLSQIILIKGQGINLGQKSAVILETRMN